MSLLGSPRVNKPVAVLISDVHYNVHTLLLADAAMRQAIAKANELEVPLIVAGDLHDTKANMRAECMNAMLETFRLRSYECFILRGNHDQINEKSKEHALNFLETLGCEVVDKPFSMDLTEYGDHFQVYLVPYYSDVKELRAYLITIPKGSTIIMHQGLQGSESGEYIQDKSALTYDDVKDFRVISGHYHKRQDIKTGRPQKGAVGLFSYIGNPYTLGFGEANDPPKGFQILMDDGTLEFIRTGLRDHVIVEGKFVDESKLEFDLKKIPELGDPLWVKIRGTKEQLMKVKKEHVVKVLELQDFRLDLIPTDTTTNQEHIKSDMSQAEVLDILIDSLAATSDDQKTRLKQLWRNNI